MKVTEKLEREENRNKIKEMMFSKAHAKKMFGPYNKVYLIGKIEEKWEEENNSRYSTMISIVRLSRTVDRIKIEVPRRLINTEDFPVETLIRVAGDYKSYTNNGESFRYIRVKDIKKTEEEDYFEENNLVYLRGFICNEPYYHISEKQQKVITAFCLAVPRRDDKKICAADYIYCVSWGEDAERIRYCKKGQELEFFGRAQSRYFYKGDFWNTDPVEVYEVSISASELWLL